MLETRTRTRITRSNNVDFPIVLSTMTPSSSYSTSYIPHTDHDSRVFKFTVNTAGSISSTTDRRSSAAPLFSLDQKNKRMEMLQFPARTLTPGGPSHFLNFKLVVS